MNEWMNEWMNESMNEWMNKLKKNETLTFAGEKLICETIFIRFDNPLLSMTAPKIVFSHSNIITVCLDSYWIGYSKTASLCIFLTIYMLLRYLMAQVNQKICAFFEIFSIWRTLLLKEVCHKFCKIICRPDIWKIY